MKNARRISQLIFFLFFLFLFFQARYPYEIHLPSDLFLRSSPLVGLIAVISSRTFIHTVIPAFIILLLTIPLGRFFCGWICPLGTVIDINDFFIKRKKPKRSELENKRFRFLKFFISFAILTASIFSLQFIWFFDPIVLLTRVMTLTIYPVFVFFLTGFFDFAFKIGFLENQVYSTYNFFQNTVLPIERPEFFASVLVLLLFAGILVLGLVSKRFWCRNICPLGALLGIFSKFRLTKRYVSESCTNCGKCRTSCKMNAIEDDYTVNNTVECIECAECVAVCPPKSVSYKWGKSTGANEIDFSRRRLVQSGIAGISLLAVIKAAAKDKSKTGKAIRPPGAIPEEEFLDRCLRCQECVRICSSTGACLQPSVLESGWEGIWSPIAVASIGYCEFNCNLCGQVCPTGAIQNITLEEKQKLKMGTAYFDKSRCIPWYSQQDCLVCEEHCPLPDKAIKFDIREARTPSGSSRVVKFPYVDETLCTGCGICENKCPVVGKKGIFVTAANNERIEPV